MGSGSGAVLVGVRGTDGAWTSGAMSSLADVMLPHVRARRRRRRRLDERCPWAPGGCSVVIVPRTDTASRLINASPDDVFAALVDRDALTAWLPPDNMTARFERFDLRTGGSYRLVLTYLEAPDGGGKSTDDSDIVEGRFIAIVPGERLVQEIDFDSDSPDFAQPMTMTWSTSSADGGTIVEVAADNVPDAISAADHQVGLNASLDNLAAYMETSVDPS